MRKSRLSLPPAIADRVRQGGDLAATYAPVIFDWCLDKLPIFGRGSVRRREAVVLEPYVRVYTLRGALAKLILGVVLPFLCLAYGFFFALMAPFVMVPYAVPIALLAVLVIWSLPDQKVAPTFGIELLLPALIIIKVLWPDYLAVAMLGLPWITLVRLVGFPIATLLLVCLSVSRRFRDEVAETFRANRLIVGLVLAFALIQVLTIPLSGHLLQSAQLVFTYQVNWTAVFVISCVIFKDIRYIERYMALLVALAVAISLLLVYESFRRHVPWMNHIPGFLKVPDESGHLALKPNIRLFLNRYRAQGTFFTPLACAEFLALMNPFFLHFIFTKRKLWIRAATVLAWPLLVTAVVLTDSRLGNVGLIVTTILYGFLWSVVRWRQNRRDLAAAAMIYAYPLLSIAMLGAVMSSGRAKVAILGGQAQASSNEMRDNQLGLALKALSRRPVGFGAGEAGESLGLPPGDFISVDNYFISVAMDYGFLGAAIWYAIWITAIVTAVRCCLSRELSERPEARLLAPVAVSIAGLLVVKWVHGQDRNHIIYYTMLGMICGLIYNIKKANQPTAEAAPVTTPPASGRSYPAH